MNSSFQQRVMKQLNHILRIRQRWMETPACNAGSYKQRVWKRENMKEEITQYVGDNARQAQRVYVWGCATTGALGIPNYLKPGKNQYLIKKINRPARMKFMDENRYRVYDVSCGFGFSVFAAKRSGTYAIFGTGINTDSQIGYHEEPKNSGRVLDYVIAPVPIYLPLSKPDTTRVSCLSSGRAHTVIVTDEDGVYSLGNNSYGQCGRTIVADEIYSKSQRINTLSDLPGNIVKVECGQDHTIFISADGQLYSCGLGADGQTGQGHYKNTGRPVKLGGDIEGENIVMVSSKGDCVLALSDKGEVFGWGNSEYNQLSMVTEATQVNIPRHLPIAGNCGKVVKVASGGSVCAVLNHKGEVFVWGYGILGKGPNLDMASEPTRIPNTLFGESELQPEVKVVDIACGLGHFVALTDKGDMYSWGKNREGCVGLGKDSDQFFPLKVSLPAEALSVHCGVDHTVIIGKSFC